MGLVRLGHFIRARGGVINSDNTTLRMAFTRLESYTTEGGWQAKRATKCAARCAALMGATRRVRHCHHSGVRSVRHICREISITALADLTGLGASQGPAIASKCHPLV